MKRTIIASIIIVTIGTIAMAQGEATTPPELILGLPKALFAQLVNIGIGVTITAIVSFAKGSEWVKAHPKIVAAGLAILGSLGTGLADVHATEGFLPYLTTFIIQLTAAIGTFEVAKTTTKAEEI
jgi:hypothetical protein